MHIQDCFKIGYIAKTHGLKGEVTLMPSPECPDLSQVSTVFIQQQASLVPFFVEAVSMRGDKAFVKLEDVNTPEAAASLKGCSVYFPKQERPTLPRGEFYNDEVIGFQVTDVALGPIGQVSHVEEAGPARFLVVMREGKEAMIPVNGPFIKSINKARKHVTVVLPNGFLDI
ncbi:MAG: ribosome maturation factor RimM [Bacteroidota bacterium]